MPRQMQCVSSRHESVSMPGEWWVVLTWRGSGVSPATTRDVQISSGSKDGARSDPCCPRKTFDHFWKLHKYVFGALMRLKQLIIIFHQNVGTIEKTCCHHPWLVDVWERHGVMCVMTHRTRCCNSVSRRRSLLSSPPWSAGHFLGGISCIVPRCWGYHGQGGILCNSHTNKSAEAVLWLHGIHMYDRRGLF